MKQWINLCPIIFLIFCNCFVNKYLYITSEPMGALIEINNISIGHTPTTFSVSLPSNVSVGAAAGWGTPIPSDSWKIRAIPSYDMNTMVTAFLDAAETTGYTHEQALEMAEVYFSKHKKTQYTQSKILWDNRLRQFKADTVKIHFDMFLEPIPKKYEIEWK